VFLANFTFLCCCLSLPLDHYNLKDFTLSILSFQPCLSLICFSIDHYSMNINCGGNEANISGQIYEADREQKGAAMLYYTGQDWALSSTGNFMDNDIDSDPYVVANTSRLNVSALNSQLYTTARVSPLALTYYGLCLINGNYTVKLHFAEIIFINDRSLYSLGRRVFDVYIQVTISTWLIFK